MGDEVEKGVGRLTNDNWPTWSARFESWMEVKDLWTAVTTADSDNTRKALAYMRLCVSDQHLPLIRHCMTAKEAWEILQGLFQQQTVARKLQLRRELATFTMGPSENMNGKGSEAAVGAGRSRVYPY